MSKTENAQPTIDRMPAVFLLPKLNLALVDDNIGSKNPNAEVIPANRIAKNSNGAKILPIGPMILKIIGKTMNTRPVPSGFNTVKNVKIKRAPTKKFEVISNEKNTKVIVCEDTSIEFKTIYSNSEQVIFTNQVKQSNPYDHLVRI